MTLLKNSRSLRWRNYMLANYAIYNSNSFISFNEYIIVCFIVFDSRDCNNSSSTQPYIIVKIFSDNHVFHQSDQRTSLFTGTRAARVSWKLLYIQMHDIACETAVRGGQICITLLRTLPEGTLASAVRALLSKFTPYTLCMHPPLLLANLPPCSYPTDVTATLHTCTMCRYKHNHRPFSISDCAITRW